jgi:hypothetical protein
MRIGPLSARREAIRVEDEGAAAAADELPKKPPARSAKSRKSAQASGHPIMHAGRDRFTPLSVGGDKICRETVCANQGPGGIFAPRSAITACRDWEFKLDDRWVIDGSPRWNVARSIIPTARMRSQWCARVGSSS